MSAVRLLPARRLLSQLTWMPTTLTTVRARLLVLILLVAVPLFAMAASIAWQNYRMVVDGSRDRARLLLTAAAARNDAVFDQAAKLLKGLSRRESVGRDGAGCSEELSRLLEMFGDRYDSLMLAGPAEGAVCQARSFGSTLGSHGDAEGAAALITAVQRSGAVEIGAVDPRSGAGRPLVLVGAPWQPTGRASGVVIARLLVDWLQLPTSAGLAAPAGSAWLVGAAPPALIEVGGPTGAPANPGARPASSALAAVLQLNGGATRIVTAQNGLPYAYAAAALRGGATLLVGVPAATDIARADAVLGRRLSELGLLLLAGLAAVATGGRLLLVQPVMQVSHAVRSWRDGGTFDPGSLEGAPSELVELARTFGEASLALRGREAELREAAVRQDLLMQEIHHRVKNNLQIIASLLNLQASRIRLPEARAEFQAARDRIRALATLHRHLYANDQFHSINMRNFLTELCSQLLAAIGETPAGGRIRLDIEAPELQISSDQAVPMALIVTEVVSNAAKYAFPGGRSGHIRVRLDVDPAAAAGEPPPRARLMIEDDGVGIPAGRTVTETGVRDGIGMQLIRGFARQLGATLTVDHDHGTHYLIDIPLHRLRDGGEPTDASVE